MEEEEEGERVGLRIGLARIAQLVAPCCLRRIILGVQKLASAHLAQTLTIPLDPYSDLSFCVRQTME